jgi:hypothetical protein
MLCPSSLEWAVGAFEGVIWIKIGYAVVVVGGGVVVLIGVGQVLNFW